MEIVLAAAVAFYLGQHFGSAELSEPSTATTAESSIAHPKVAESLFLRPSKPTSEQVVVPGFNGVKADYAVHAPNSWVTLASLDAALLSDSMAANASLSTLDIRLAEVSVSDPESAAITQTSQHSTDSLQTTHPQWVSQGSQTQVALADLATQPKADLAMVAPLVAAVAESALVVSPKPIEWQLKVEDVRLDKALKRWAKEAGYTIRWDADRYVMIGASSIFTGSFENAVEQVLETPGIKFSEYPLEACVYANEPPLLRITRLGDQSEECR